MWTRELAESLTSVEHLRRAGLLTPTDAERLAALGERFRVRITPYYAGLMSDRPDCPIRRQAIPQLGEEDPALPEWATRWSQEIYGRPVPWTADAIGDVEKLAAPRLTHRYGNRAILHLSTMCAVYCRFCFRKEHLNEREAALYEGSLDPAFAYLAAHAEIRELILTGGDPLSVTDAALQRVLERAAAIPHLRVVRIHSRMAVTLPARLTPELAELLAKPGRDDLGVHLVSHFNHPREWTREARQGLRELRRRGIPLYNQNVLLNGINSDADVLAELFQALYEDGVTPMYLHHADWTPGTFQFRTSVARGQALMRELRGRLPGAALPHYVVESGLGQGKASLLDASTCMVRKLDELSIGDHGIQGAVYELQAPRTRTGAPSLRYLDLFPAGC